MSEESSETSPEILVNGERKDKTAEAEEQISSVSLHDETSEDSSTTEKEAQLKMQSVFQQVRNQIRSQGGVKAPKSGILELLQKVKGREAELNSEDQVKDVNAEEEKKIQLLAEKCKDEVDLTLEGLYAIFEEKLEASKKALKDEFEVQVSLLREEMKVYTDRALKDLMCKMQSCQSPRLQQTCSKDQQEAVAADKKQKPSALPSLASRRRKLLTRTMTTIIPKTPAPVITGQHAKSETLSASKGQSSRFLLRDQVLSLPDTKPYQSRNPLPPARPPLQQRKKPTQAKSKTGK